MADLDLDAALADANCCGYTGHHIRALVAEVQRLQAEQDALATGIRWARQDAATERDALVAAVRWAQDAPHRAACMKWYAGNRYRCTCGRDEALAPFGDDQ